MRTRFASMGLVVVLSAAGLALGQFRGGTSSDLDSFSDEQLARDLQDELDDVFDRIHPEAEVDLDVLHNAIMAALSDYGDAGLETEISMADLLAEMGEIETSLEDVIADALDRADQVASHSGSPVFRHASMGIRAHAQSKNGRTKSKIGLQFTSRGLVGAVRGGTERSRTSGSHGV